MNIPRHRKGNALGYGLGLLGLLITVAIGMYIWSQMTEADAKAYKHVEKQVDEIQNTLDQHQADLEKQFPEMATPDRNHYAVVLLDAGDHKDKVAEAIRMRTSLTPEQARDLVDSAPLEVKGHIRNREAESIRTSLEALGAKAMVRDEQEQQK